MNVIEGRRPSQPENASAIGFSDSLWGFVQRCWDGNSELRPKAAEVVSQLAKVAVDWDGVSEPRARIESLASAPPEPNPDSMACCKSQILTPPTLPTEQRHR